MTDDHGYGELSCHGNRILKTPNLDRLHSQSTRFTAFHVSPTCAPTRSALLTGRHEFKNGVTHTILERERLSLDSTTLAQILKLAGYATGIFGKWHLGDEEEYQPHKRGFDETFIHGAGGIGQAYQCSCADAPGNKYFDPVIRHNGGFVKTRGFCTDVFFLQARDWIHRQGEKKQPFFAYITPNAPHSPYISPESYAKPYKDAGLKPDVAAYYGMIANIDDNVGKLLAKLDEWGLANNTLVIFMTDNGHPFPGSTIFNAGMRANKGTAYEGGTRVPAFFRWPGKLQAGVDIDRLAAHIDMLPTLCDICDATPKAGVSLDGRSLMPLLRNGKADWPDRFLFVHRGRWEKGMAAKSKHDFCAVRSQRFRLVHNKELYDIANDPAESKNVIDEHPQVVAEMRKAYDAWWNDVLPLLVNENAPLNPERPYHVLYRKQESTRGIPDWTPAP